MFCAIFMGFLLLCETGVAQDFSAEKPAQLGDEFEVICADNRTTESVIEQDEQFPPIFQKKSTKKVVAVPAGKTVRLNCRAHGRPKPKIRWSRNEIPFKPPSHCKKCKWSLTLRNATPEHQGAYACEVWNPRGKIRRQFTVRVVQRLRSRPIISLGFPKNTSVRIGETARFECPLFSDLVPIVVWLKRNCVNGVCGQPFEVVQNSNVEEINNLSHPPTLLIKKVRPSDAGAYICVAGNSLGVSQSTAFLTVQESIKNLDNNQLTITVTTTVLETVTEQNRSVNSSLKIQQTVLAVGGSIAGGFAIVFLLATLLLLLIRKPRKNSQNNNPENVQEAKNAALYPCYAPIVRTSNDSCSTQLSSTPFLAADNSNKKHVRFARRI